MEEQGDLGLKSDEEINRILAEEEAKEAANGGEMTPDSYPPAARQAGG
jgi:hypothetical protein